MLSRFIQGLEKNILNSIENHNRKTCKDNNDTKLLLGKMFANQIKAGGQLDNLQEAEFKVFSQFDDDGIIQYLVQHLDIDTKVFIEFGVENYLEANTRFLLMNNNWRGLVMDGSDQNVTFIKNDEIYWKYDLTARSAFVTAENINEMIASAGFGGELGLLHIDIDGNDYWVWKAIDAVNPVIAIIEYNSLFGSERAITVPYDPAFYRMTAHHSCIYAGASLPSLCDLANEKGYAFVGSNSAGNNAYFVREDRLGSLRTLTPEEGYVASKFREHRDEEGRLTFLSGREALEKIRGMKVFNTRTKEIEKL